jgi:hypothetical protein
MRKKTAITWNPQVSQSIQGNESRALPPGGRPSWSRTSLTSQWPMTTAPRAAILRKST